MYFFAAEMTCKLIWNSFRQFIFIMLYLEFYFIFQEINSTTLIKTFLSILALHPINTGMNHCTDTRPTVQAIIYRNVYVFTIINLIIHHVQDANERLHIINDYMYMTFIVSLFEISIKRGNHFHGDKEMSAVRMHITLVGQNMESAHLSKPKQMFLALPVKTSMFRFRGEKFRRHVWNSLFRGWRRIILCSLQSKCMCIKDRFYFGYLFKRRVTELLPSWVRTLVYNKHFIQLEDLLIFFTNQLAYQAIIII